MDSNMKTHRRQTSAKKRNGILLLLPAILTLLASSASFNIYVDALTAEAKAFQTSSVVDIEMITSWAPSDPARFNPHTGSLLAPLMIPRVSGTANNTRVQEFILDFFAKLNATSLAGTSTTPEEDGQDKHSQPIAKRKVSKRFEAQVQEKEKVFRRAPGTTGTGWHVELDQFVDKTPFGEKTFTNLIFTKNPKAENRLVFAAHFDSKYFPPTETKPRKQWNGGDDTLPFVAATDSAAPCAILLDLAASLDSALDQSGRDDSDTTLQLIFFDGEEAFEDWRADDSLYGSRHLAEKWEKQRVTRSRMATGRNGGSTSNNLDGIELFVLLDLLGVENPRVPSYFGATHWAHEHSLAVEQRLWDAKLHGGQVLARRKEGRSEERADEDDDDMDTLETEEPMKAYFTKQASWGGIDDDHRPFMQRGVPIFHVIPTPFPHVWHKLEDDASVISQEVVEGWANIFRTFTVEYLQLLKAKPIHRRDEL
ncbi:hypothetical protein BGZ96_001437 [Linnemannia gamsii]|uniref:Peptide hydrolase n=1 Tax=Linnemannia gamsii TaxID=64522 RepID=A0ABQ7JMV5_9FUNG|nr:hypothetical protein BGZ96_001437 [Linnemannia gamsii]